MAEEKCGNCKFCRTKVKPLGEGYLACQKNAPAPALPPEHEAKVQNKRQPVWHAKWPVVHHDDWCGEWRQKV